MCSVDVLLGPFIVSVGEWKEEAQGPALFKVHVSGSNGSRTVLRRYKEFAALDREVRSRRNLPALPPRSLGRLCVPSGFLERRRRGLGTFLAAAVASDPHCVHTSALREFLGLPSLPTLQSLLGDDCSDGGSTTEESSSDLVPSCLSDLKLYPIAETSLAEHESFRSPSHEEQ